MTRRNRPQCDPGLESLFRLVDHADLADDPAVQRLVAAATVTDSTANRRRIERVLALKAVQHQRRPFDDEPPYVAPWKDRLSLGTTITGSTYDLAQADLTQHLLAIGQSGAGKTTLFYNVMDQLTVPFWAFDLKQDYRHRLQHDEDLFVLPWTELKFNPLKPPDGVRPRRWAHVFVELFGHATALLSGSKNYLMKQVIECYRLYDLFDAVEPPYPSLHELQVVMEQDKINYVRKAANYRDTVVNRLEAMNLTAGTVFDCSEGYPIEELLDRNVVFEFDGLGTDLQNFLMEILFAYVEYRVARDQRGGDLRHVFFLDEGKQVFSVYKERQDAAGIPAVDKLTAKMREFGEGLVVADQEATKLTDSIKANTKTTLLLATGDATQFEEVAASMHLTDRQQDIARTLGTGDAIIQTGNREPCPVQLANYELAKTISDAELWKHQRQAWNALSATPRERPAAFEQAVAQSDADDAQQAIPDDPPQDLDLSDGAERLLRDVVEHPFKALTERYALVGNDYRGNKAKEELVEEGIVVERKVRPASEKRTLLELTDQGREYVETHLDVDTKRRGRGGIVHRYWQHRLKELFDAAGWTAKRELFDADIYVNMADTELVIEVAMGNNAREVKHVEHHLETGFDAIWVVCQTEAVRDGVRQRLEENGLFDECVTVRLVSEISSEQPDALA